MRTCSLKIISAEDVFYDGRMGHLVVPATDGQLGILPGHEEMIIALNEGVLKYDDGDGIWHFVAIGRGVMEFANNRCVIVVDTAERPEDIDVNRAKEAKRRAEEQMRQKISDREYRELQAALARALTRLKLTDKE